MVVIFLMRTFQAFADMKEYYNSITINNLALINSLKDSVEELKLKQSQLNAKYRQVSQRECYQNTYYE